jgi:Spherulation-specific family 4
MLKKSSVIVGLLALTSLPIGMALNSMVHSANPEVAVAKATKKEPVLQILMPLYLYPSVVNGRSNWQPLADAAAKVPIVAIINPNSGPGGKPNSDYLAAMKLLQKAGVKMVGYVATDYGKRPMAKIKAEIDLYDRYFNVQGIFLDEGASAAQHHSHYSQIYKYIRSKPKLQQVITNPGTHLDEKYFSQPAADRAVIFENAGQEWPQYQPSTYLSKYGRQHFALMLHGVPDRLTMEKYLDLAVQRNIGYVYITDDKAATNPWDSFPSYWSAEIDSIRAKNLAAK